MVGKRDTISKGALMAVTGKLNPRSIKAAKPGEKIGDGGGLWLDVKPDGSKYWSVRFTFNKKRREMGLGPLELVSLAEAREKARRARRLVREGVDPIARRRQEQRKAVPTFHEAWTRYVKAHEAGWKNRKHRQQWANTLKTYADPFFGEKPVDLVDVTDVLNALEPIWTTKTETAGRLRGRIEKVLDWAKVRGYRRGDNPATWRGNLQALLPARNKIQKVDHFKAVPFVQVGRFLEKLRKRPGMAARALEFLILTASRPGMVRKAEWSEFDLEAGLWTVPADHMKAKREFRVPLSKQAVKLLRSLPVVDGSPLVFPSPRGKVASDMVFNALLKRMGVSVTAHGFRSSFKDWATETTSYANILSEAALAHIVADKTEAAYRRGDLFDKRTKLMQDWADYCSRVQTEKTAKVTAIGAGR